MTIYAVTTRTEGISGFEWFYRYDDAQSWYAKEMESSSYFKSIGERYDVAYGTIEIPFDSNDSKRITSWIDTHEELWPRI